MSLEDSAKRVAEFVKLAEKATPGPWTLDEVALAVYGRNRGGSMNAVSDFRLCDIRGWGHLQYREDGEAQQDANGKFIASSRKIPDDFAEIVREARILAERLQDHIDGEYSANCEEALEFLRLTAPIVGEEGQG